MKKIALLFLLSMLCAAASASDAPAAPSATLDPAKAIEELKKVGGKLKFDEKVPGKPLIAADLGDIDIKDDALANLDALPMLKSLSLRHGYKVTAAGLDHLKGLTKLETLDIWDVKAGLHDQEFAKLVKELPQLVSLNVGGCPITDAALAALEGNQNLQTLVLTYTNVTDAGLLHLKGLTNLKKLALPSAAAWVKISEDGVKKLQEALPNCKISR